MSVKHELEMGKTSEISQETIVEVKMESNQGVAYVFSGRNGDKEELSKEELIETWKLEREGEGGVKEFSA